jgi:hypothetical protein
MFLHLGNVILHLNTICFVALHESGCSTVTYFPAATFGLDREQTKTLLARLDLMAAAIGVNGDGA